MGSWCCAILLRGFFFLNYSQSRILNIRLEMWIMKFFNLCSIKLFFQSIAHLPPHTVLIQIPVTNGLVSKAPWKCHVGVNKTTQCMFYKELQPPLNCSDFHLGQAGLATSCLDGCAGAPAHHSVTCPTPQFTDVAGRAVLRPLHCLGSGRCVM